MSRKSTTDDHPLISHGEIHRRFSAGEIDARTAAALSFMVRAERQAYWAGVRLGVCVAVTAALVAMLVLR